MTTVEESQKHNLKAVVTENIYAPEATVVDIKMNEGNRSVPEWGLLNSAF